jgi:hypothetical protein
MIGLNHVIVLLFVATFAVHTNADDALPALPGKDVFQVILLAGQSNMAGRGEVAEADREIHPRVLMLAKDGSWQYAVDPIHYDKKMAGAGLAKSFALELVKRDPDITIGLVPAACGGSHIAHWEPGAYYEKTDSHPYDDAISRTRRAVQDGTLKAILWHQGEGDSGPGAAAVYEDKLTDLIERFREDLAEPDLPFIIGQLGQFSAKPWSSGRAQVNKAQIQVAEKVPHSAFVSSEGLTSKGDNTHFNTESLHEFGKRYAHEYLLLIGAGH